MVRLLIVTAAMAPLVIISLWGDTLALFVGVARTGAQARYFPPPESEPGRHRVHIEDTRRVVPSEGMPSEVAQLKANNNLDAVRHSDGRVYLAWRTAPDHFASADTQIQIVSSDDEQHWRFEHRIHMGTDLREPRLLSLNGSLFVYFSKLGKNRFAFEPGGMAFTERKPDGNWTAVEPLDLPGYIGWRTRVERGRAYMVAYLGGENIYQFDGEPLHIDLLTTDDGRHFRPVDPEHRTVYTGGGSEADFTLADDGTLYAVIRNEAGDDYAGFGSLVCTAPPDKLAHWSCTPDARKYDSPYAFFHDGEAYVVARRNVTEDGRYDQDIGFFLLRSITNQLHYITSGKRCALWRFVDGGSRLAFIRDLPSRGDTCFPAVLSGSSADALVVYDYSSPLEGPDPAWSVGQRGPTHIYRHQLRFESGAP